MLLLLVSACAAHTPRTAQVPPDRSILTAEELAQHRFATVYEGLLALRPTWLQTRGVNSLQSAATQIQVYLDNTRLGGIDQLSVIQLSSVVYIRHYDGIEATARWGLDHGQGAIYVSTHAEGNIGP